jgi:hypothetical protein
MVRTPTAIKGYLLLLRAVQEIVLRIFTTFSREITDLLG